MQQLDFQLPDEMLGRTGSGAVVDDEPFCLWTENVPAWNAWLAVQTQWRVGMAGATGLDYQGVRAALDEMGLDPEQRRSIFCSLQACERAALEAWDEQREQRQRRERQQR